MTDEELIALLRDDSGNWLTDGAADRIEALTEQLAAARHDAKEAEAYAEELEEENRLMKTAGIIEVAVRNPSVMEYMKQWEGRVEALEAKLQSSEFATQKGESHE